MVPHTGLHWPGEHEGSLLFPNPCWRGVGPQWPEEEALVGLSMEDFIIVMKGVGPYERVALHILTCFYFALGGCVAVQIHGAVRCGADWRWGHDLCTHHVTGTANLSNHCINIFIFNIIIYIYRSHRCTGVW